MIQIVHARLPGPGRIFAGPRPSLPFAETAAALREAGVSTIACLLERGGMPPALGQAYAAAGLELLAFPIADMGVPESAAAFRAFLRDLRARVESGESVYLHCFAGLGRTGLALACLLVMAGEPAASAVATVRAAYRREAVETPEQRRFIEAFEAEDPA